MDWLWFFWLLPILAIIYVCFSRPCEKNFNRIVELMEAEHFQEAYDALQRFSKNKYALLVGYSDKILTCKAFCLLNLSYYREAIEIYDRLIKKIPDVKGNQNWLHQIYFLKASALTNLELCSEAIACLDRAIEYKPDNPLVWYLRACALSDLEQYSEAINNCDRALYYQPENCDIWLSKAYILYELEDYRNAMVNCEYVLQNQPENYLGWELKAKILYELQDYRAAIASCDLSIEIQPQASTFYGRACCYALLRDTELAIASLQQAISLAPLHGYEDGLNTNEDFDNIRQDKRFQKLLQKELR